MDDIAIIGGGAAGLAAAIEASSRLRDSYQDGSVIVYEASDKVGRSILRSGNGRCNYTNANITGTGISRLADTTMSDQPTYHNEAFVNAVLQALESIRPSEGQDNGQRGNEASSSRAGNDRDRELDTHESSLMHNDGQGNAVQDFFDELGLMWREEGDGRRYPLSGKASTVLNLLRDACSKLGVCIECDTQIDKIEPRNIGDPAQASFALRVRDGRILHARRVILATGGNTAATILADALAITTTPTRPILAPLALRESKLTRRMDNIRVKCSVFLLRDERVIAREKGEVLFRKYGISGIAVFNLSRHALPGDRLRVEIIDELDKTSLTTHLITTVRNVETRTGITPTNADILRGVVQDPVADALAIQAHVDLDSPASKKALSKLAMTLKALDFTVEGIGDASVAQVHRGGVDISCVDAQTMEALAIPGLFITGEALDVDGPCGGYNLHWAWATGLLAGACSANC